MLSTVLLCVFFLVIAFALVLQVVRGSSQLEVEHQMLEQEARETDLKLSLNEIMGRINEIAASDSGIEMDKNSLPQHMDIETLNARRPSVSIVPMNGIAEKNQADMLKRGVASSLYGQRWGEMLAPSRKDGFTVTLYPCFVMEHETMQAVSRLPFHEDALGLNQLEVLRPDTRSPSPSHSYFISQVCDCRSAVVCRCAYQREFLLPGCYTSPASAELGRCTRHRSRRRGAPPRQRD